MGLFCPPSNCTGSGPTLLFQPCTMEHDLQLQRVGESAAPRSASAVLSAPRMGRLALCYCCTASTYTTRLTTPCVGWTRAAFQIQDSVAFCFAGELQVPMKAPSHDTGRAGAGESGIKDPRPATILLLRDFFVLAGVRKSALQKLTYHNPYKKPTVGAVRRTTAAESSDNPTLRLQ